MKTPLIGINILSIYTQSGKRVYVPERMAKCTPDTYSAIFNIKNDLESQGGKLVLSDLFRTYNMQSQAHNDYVSGKKKAYSPPPGGGFHEAGRAFDLSLGDIGIPLADFWKIAAKYGVIPIIAKPISTASEAWHFDCRGSHQLVYDYYKNGNGNNFKKPYTAAAASAILSIGVHVDYFQDQKQAAIQSALIRLGKNIGNMDGYIGKNTQKALQELNVKFDMNDLDGMLIAVENLIQVKFPEEFATPVLDNE
ncbi:hypothetical protein FACS189426_14340 [Bacteroidia bacterium]|nr:hypothetical protein FACS189426_14340 [Bacteroidia bacterium]GHV70498.1 hypothetical protein FACS189420_1830 [Bacteroidia bacterium]